MFIVGLFCLNRCLLLGLFAGRGVYSRALLRKEGFIVGFFC